MSSPTTEAQKSGSVSDLDPRRWVALIFIGIAQLMVVLDATIVNIALPDAATALHISDANRQWIVTAYALPFGALLLLGGRIGDYLGRKKVLMIALGGFAVASAIGGIAQNFVMLAGARALQGIFAAMLAPSTLSMLTVTFRDPKERAKAFAVFGAIAGGGAAVGLVLGGLLTEYATWRWCLLVNIPISVVAIVGTSIYLHESSTERQGSYDVLGALLATLGLGMLVWGFNQASSHTWSSPNTWGWLIGAVVLLALFAVLNSRNPHAILPMRILKNRNRAGAYLRLAGFEELHFVRRYCAKLLYEVEVYSGTVGWKALPDIYVESLASATGFRYKAADAFIDLDSRFYSTRYLRAWQLQALLDDGLVNRFDEDWWRNPAAGPWIVGELFAEGQRETADEVARRTAGADLSFGPLTRKIEALLAS